MAQLLIVRADGEVHEIVSDKPFRDLLSPKESYIINLDDKRTIYLWKGSECSVRSKFIGASKSQEVRGQVGMHYKVVPIDEGDEPKEFLAFLDQTPQKGLAKEIREEKELGFEVPGVTEGDVDAAKPSPEKAEELREKAEESRARFGQGAPTVSNGGNGAQQVMSSAPGYQNSGPLYSGGSMGNQQAQPVAPEVKLDFKKIMETLESLEIPEGYEREMIIIGNQAFSIVEKKVSFLGNEKVDKVMEKISTLPEGVFFAQGYAPRVLCEDQKILAIEFLKATSPSKSSSAQKLKAKTQDPKELAKQFGMNV